MPITFEAESGAVLWAIGSESRCPQSRMGGQPLASHQPLQYLQYTTSQNAQGESRSAQQAHCAELKRVQDWFFTKSQINVQICMIIESTIVRPHEDRGKGELWSPLFIADSSGRRPEV